ncbi:MAG: hypothetical protein ABW044_04120, partial [Cellvibrio sp.]
DFQPVIVKNLKDYDDFFYTPQKYYDQLARQTKSNIILLVSVGRSNNKFSIRYLLKSEKGGWSAYLHAETVPVLLEKMNANIALVVQSKILDVDIQDSTLLNARLKILHQQSADDLIVLSRLAESEINTGNTNNAVILADELAAKARSQNDPTAEADSYIISANAYVAQSLYDEAHTRLQKANVIFQAAQSHRGLGDVQRAYAGLAFAKNDYALLKQSLVSAIEFAQLTKDPLLKVRNMTYLSVMANKYGEKNDRQTYLDQAESVLDQTHQAKEHYGIIYFYAGMYADTEAAAEKNYRKVLNLLPANQTWWERERSQEHLAQLLVKQARWQAALDLFSGEKSLGASEELAIASIYYAQHLWTQADTHAQSAFKLASLNGHAHLVLDAALSLVDIHQQAGTSEKAQAQLQFIHREAKNVPYWIKFNKGKLERLGISL